MGLSELTTDAVRDRCTDAVFERGQTYLADGRIRRIDRVDDEVTAVVSGSRPYDVRVDFSAAGVETWCDCPYDGPGTCKHVVAVLLRCIADPPADDGERLDDHLSNADADALRGFLREALASNRELRDRFLARFGASTSRSVEDVRAEIDHLFAATNPEYAVVFEPIDFGAYFDLAATYRERGQYESGATIHRALVESLDDNMHLVDGAYDHFSRAFSDALDGYVDCVANADFDSDAADYVVFLDRRARSGTPSLRDDFERDAAEIRER